MYLEICVAPKNAGLSLILKILKLETCP